MSEKHQRINRDMINSPEPHLVLLGKLQGIRLTIQHSHSVILLHPYYNRIHYVDKVINRFPSVLRRNKKMATTKI